MKTMFIKARWTIVISVLSFAANLFADEFYMTAADPWGTSSFNSAGKWSNGLAPSAGNTYLTAFVMRMPTVTGASYTFAGDQLTINTGSDFGLTTPGGSITVTNMVLHGGRVTHSTGQRINTLSGQITVATPSTFYVGDNLWRWLYLRSALSGTADLTIQVTDSLKRAYLMAENSAFTGRMLLSGLGKVVVTQEEGLGGNPAAFQADALALRGVTLSVTNSFVIDDPNRGIYINNTLTPSSYIYPGAIFEVNEATLTVACAVSGAGPLTKIGTGTLFLATNNTFTGLLTVQEGTLRIAAGATPATSSVIATGQTSVVTGEGVLNNLTLAAGAQLMAENSGWSVSQLTVSNANEIARISLTLSDDATNTPMIRVGGPLVKPPFQKIVFTVTTNNLLQAPYQLLSASNLTDYAESDFYLSPPWAGELSLTNDAGGGKALVFTPAAAKVVHQINNDPGGTSAFTRSAAWLDGLAPSAGKTYVSSGYILRTPNSGSATFAGDTLFVESGGLFALKGLGIPTVNNLILFNNATLSASEGDITGNYLAGTVHVFPSDKDQYTATFLIPSDGMGRTARIYATLVGCGDIVLQYSGTALSPASYFAFYADNPDFLGRICVDANTNVWLSVDSEENLGGNPPLFRTDQLSFSGGGLKVTSDVTLDDANRGITLVKNVCTLNPTTGATLTVNCPITGPGALMKKGEGTLVLGGENNYIGLTSVIAGSVRPTAPSAFGVSAVSFAADTALLRYASDTALTNGVEFESTVTFEEGSTIQLVFDGETAGAVTLPLFLLQPGDTIDLETLSVSYALPNHRLAVLFETIGEGAEARELVSAKLTVTSTLITLQ
jgi:autotransporter-associated beta strand protein